MKCRILALNCSILLCLAFSFSIQAQPSIGIDFSPQLMRFDIQKSDAYSIGFTYFKNISDRFGLETRLQLSIQRNMPFCDSLGVINPAILREQLSCVKTHKENRTYIELPLLARFTILKKQKLNVDIEGGGQFSLLVYESDTSPTIWAYHHNKWALVYGLKSNYQLSETLFFRYGILLEHRLTPRVKNHSTNSTPLTWGLSIGIGWQL